MTQQVQPMGFPGRCYGDGNHKESFRSLGLCNWEVALPSHEVGIKQDLGRSRVQLWTWHV